MTTRRESRISAIINWGSIQSYLGEKKDKMVEFSTAAFRAEGYPYNPRGFSYLMNKGLIRTVRRDHGGTRGPFNVYTLGERFMKMDLSDILSLSYPMAVKVYHK